MVLIVFGMVLGASVGLADGVMGLHAWQMLGQPDFFIRRNWGEVPTIAILTFSGTLAGILYGGFLVRMSASHAAKLHLGRIYCSSMIAAIPIFFCAHYYVIAHRGPLTFIPEIFVFLLCIVLALYIEKRKGRTPPEPQ